MKVLDANLLLYAYDSTSPQHAAARARIERVFSSDQPVGLPWQTIMAFLRVVTNPRLPGERYSAADAIDLVEQWLRLPNVRVLSPGNQHWVHLRDCIVNGQARGPLLTDAQLAALTIEYGGTLYTTDRDFARFAGLRWNDPLIG